MKAVLICAAMVLVSVSAGYGAALQKRSTCTDSGSQAECESNMRGCGNIDDSVRAKCCNTCNLVFEYDQSVCTDSKYRLRISPGTECSALSVSELEEKCSIDTYLKVKCCQTCKAYQVKRLLRELLNLD